MSDDIFMETIERRYPYYLIRDGFQMKKHQTIILQKMMTPVKGKRGDFPIYLEKGGDLYELGEIFRASTKAFIDLIGVDNLVLQLDEERQLTGDMLFVLS